MSSSWLKQFCAAVACIGFTLMQQGRGQEAVPTRASQVVHQQDSERQSPPPPHPIRLPELVKEDQAVIDRAFEELSKITDETARGIRGRELMEKVLPELTSEEGRAYASLAIAIFSGKGGDSEFAKEGLHKVLADFPETQSALVAANQLIALYQSELDYAAAAGIAAIQFEREDLSEAQRVYFGCQLATMLVPSGHMDEAFSLYQNLATDHPELEWLIGPSFEAAAASAMTNGSNERYYTQLKWIHEHMPNYAADSRFIGNFAHAAQVNGKHRESLISLKAFSYL